MPNSEMESVSMEAVFKSSDDDKRLVYGVVLEPDSFDLHEDLLSFDTIEKAAHNYLITSRVVGDNHLTKAEAEVVESFLAPVDYTLGEELVRKGSWVMVVKVHDDDLWQGIKKGEYTGFSIGGVGRRVPYE